MSSNILRSEVNFNELELRRWFSHTYPKAVADSVNTALHKAAGKGVQNIKWYIRKDTGSAAKSARRHTKPMRWSPRGSPWARTFLSVGGYIVNPKTGEVVDYAKYLDDYMERHDGSGFMEKGVKKSVEYFPYFLRIELMKRYRWL